MNYQRLIPLLALLLLIGGAVHAQQSTKPCTTNKNAPSASTWHWPAGTHVKVYLMRDMFTPSEQQTIGEVLAQWNSLSERVGTGVRYDFAGFADKYEEGEGNLTLTRIEILKGTNNKFGAYFFPTRDTDGLLRSGVITFDFQTTAATALKSYAMHELGHGMGLSDCKGCEGKSTIMNEFPNVNKDNGLMTASACDVQVVKALFDEERKSAQLSHH